MPSSARQGAILNGHNERMRAADFAFFDVPFTAFAHRGGATYEPNLYRENSLHAFKEAVALGYRYLETMCTPPETECCWHSMIEYWIGSPIALAR